MDRIWVAGLGLLAALGVTSCGKNHSGDDQAGNDGSNQFHQDACTGIGCNISTCSGMPPTSIKGTVFAPNGTLPLYDVSVYIPNSDPGPFPDGVQCTHCSDPLPGNPIVSTTTGTDGSFELDNIPDGDNIPVVITIGKWRRQLVLPHVASCTQTMMTNADTTLPKSRTDMSPNTKSVDLPKIAISTGNADSLECLIRRLGIDDKEITTLGQDGQVHLYADTKAGNGEGASTFQSGFGGGSGKFADSQTLWGSTEGAGGNNNGDLATYDIVILSCEGGQHEETKNQAAMDNLKAYADMGGRVFMSHWHNIWIEGDTENSDGKTKPMVWPTLATFDDDNGNDPGNGTVDVIDETHNPKGSDFASWMIDPQVMGSTTRDDVAIEDGTAKQTCTSVDDTNVERWINLDPTGANDPQMFQFETPSEQTPDNRCGKVVFSDMHVSGGPVSQNGNVDAYPKSCGTTDTLSPQEKALAFMFFDISSCAGAPIE